VHSKIEKPATEDGKRVRFMVPMTPAAIPTWDAQKVTVAAAFCE